MTHRVWWRVCLLVLTLASGSACNDSSGNCGEPGTNSVASDGGGCECQVGYLWRDPAGTSDFTCVSASSEPQDCTPVCSGKSCGPDGCGGDCGLCAAGTACDMSTNTCETSDCVPNCAGRSCGADPVCGQSCGDCSEGICNAGVCEADEIPPPDTAVPVGQPCTSDSACAGGTCVSESDGLPGGYCTVFNCGNAGCPTGSECFELGDDTLCLETCSDNSCRAGYACYEPGACWVADERCTADSCDPGMIYASNGACVEQAPDLPTGPIPTCTNLPAPECEGNESYCGELIPFTPVNGPGYWNYPLNGETEDNQWRSYARRDLVMLVKYATAAVDCLSAGWDFGNVGVPLGLGDMSEANGAIPGTAVGQPGHPAGSHTDGHDMDIAYYQLGTPDNTLRPICAHTSGGQDQYHCVSPPDLLDRWRTALLFGYFHDADQLLWIGIDGKAGPSIDSAIDQLCAAGWLNNSACTNSRVTYEVTNQGIGWFHFHHHHFHIGVVNQFGQHPEL